ncbi:MAG: alpha/beta fold hydrolase [Beijerinckiaceae bacterium]
MTSHAADRILFPDFRTFDVDAGGVTIHGVAGGSGPPVLLLHGYPQTHAIWHRVAPELAKRFTVVATDLTGYGDSAKPTSSAPDHAPYRKSTMARDQRLAMQALGHERFHLVGHDRGGRVAHRLALDFPDAVQTLTTLDIAPTLHMYQNTSDAFARAYWHWFFLIKATPVPETMIGADPDFFIRQHMSRGPKGVGLFNEIAFGEYLRCFSNPAVIHAACEDYRASATVDMAQDAADLGRLRIRCPMLALWGTEGAVGKCFDVLGSWREWADDVRGEAVASGHYIAEEVPEVLLELLELHCLA